MSAGTNGNGNGRRGIVGAAATVLSTLPGQFLALVLITGIFNGGMIFFFLRQGEARERVLRPLIEACANSVPIEALKLLSRPTD